MSDVVGALKIENQVLVFIDFSRPVWVNSSNSSKGEVPSLEHFVVDGILGVAGQELLIKLGITGHFTDKDFLKDPPSLDLKAARALIYGSKGFSMEYVYPDGLDTQVAEDLNRFSNSPLTTQVSKEVFAKIIEPSSK